MGIKFFDDKIAFGLDISDRSLRLVQLGTKGKKIFVRSYNELTLPPNCLLNGEIINQNLFVSSIEKLIKTKLGNGALSEKVVAVLPEEKTFLKVINLDGNGETGIEQAIKENLPKHIPIDLDESYFDWQIVNRQDKSQDVLVGTAPKTTVDLYTDSLKKAGLVPVAMEIEASAIARCLLDTIPDGKQQIIIDIGGSRTGLFLYENGTVKFTVSLDISGQKITELISQTLELDEEQAEKAKIVCGLDQEKCHGAILEIFSETVDKLVEQIKRSIIFYESNFNRTADIEKIILCGGGANFSKIETILASKLNLKIEISDPWKKINPIDKAYFEKARSQSFITALGLALRGLEYENYEV